MRKVLDEGILRRFTHSCGGCLWAIGDHVPAGRRPFRGKLVVRDQALAPPAGGRLTGPQAGGGRAGVLPGRGGPGPARGPRGAAARRDAGRIAGPTRGRVRASRVPGRSLVGTGRTRFAAQKKPSTPPSAARPVALRAAFVEAVARDEDPTRFKFVEETGLHLAFARRYGRAPDG